MSEALFLELSCDSASIVWGKRECGANLEQFLSFILKIPTLSLFSPPPPSQVHKGWKRSLLCTASPVVHLCEWSGKVTSGVKGGEKEVVNRVHPAFVCENVLSRNAVADQRSSAIGSLLRTVVKGERSLLAVRRYSPGRRVAAFNTG